MVHAGLLGLKIGTSNGKGLALPEVLQVSLDERPALQHTVIPASPSPIVKREESAGASQQPEGILPNTADDPSRYYFSSEVDVRAQPLKMQALIYPEQAFQLRQYGMVKLRVFINEEGGIDAVDVVEATPPGVFEAAALKAVIASRFVPAEKDGRKVKNQKLIEINFDPYENIAGLPQDR